jgi:hypothetical protein
VVAGYLGLLGVRMHVLFTPKAMVEVREEIAALRDPTAGLMIFRGIAGADLKRGPNGEVIWAKKPRVTWRAWCIPLAEWPVEVLNRTEVDGIRVVLLAAGPDTPQTFRISLKRGQLQAAPAA